MQELEQQLCLAIPGYNLAAIDDTDIETVFSFVAFLLYEQEKAHNGLVQVNGKWYRKVDSFKQAQSEVNDRG